MGSTRWTLTARWILPMEGPPLEEGTVVIQDQRIAAVEPHGRCTADVDLGNAAVLPGLVNAHTHLDLTGLRGLAPPSNDFTAWLRLVIHHRRSITPEQVQKNIQAGLAEILASGTTLVGDIAAGGVSWPLLAEAPLRAVVFYELLGLSRARARTAWADARKWLAVHQPLPTCRPGLSPHAPYSVRASLFRRAATLARREGFPLSIHLAESHAEQELLNQRRGKFVAFLEELGAWDSTGLVKGTEEVVHLTREVPQVLFIHGNFLERTHSLPRGGTVVYCPRTHAAFGHRMHPWVQSQKGGADNQVRVAVGTDSLASNPDLDVLQEVRFIHSRHPEVSTARLMNLVTRAGAEALGWGEETGSLGRGKSADLVVVPLSSATGNDPFQLVLESPYRVDKVLFRGRWTHTDAPTSPG